MAHARSTSSTDGIYHDLFQIPFDLTTATCT